MLSARACEFIEHHKEAVMVTLRGDGSPMVCRVWVGLVDGELLCSATAERLRTRQLRRDPRSTLCILNPGGWEWLGVEGEVAIVEGPESIPLNLALFRVTVGEPTDLAAYFQRMADERRIIYRWTVTRVYGQTDSEHWPASYGPEEAERQRQIVIAKSAPSGAD